MLMYPAQSPKRRNAQNMDAQNLVLLLGDYTAVEGLASLSVYKFINQIKCRLDQRKYVSETLFRTMSKRLTSKLYPLHTNKSN